MPRASSRAFVARSGFPVNANPDLDAIPVERRQRLLRLTGELLREAAQGELTRDEATAASRHRHPDRRCQLQIAQTRRSDPGTFARQRANHAARGHPENAEDTKNRRQLTTLESGSSPEPKSGEFYFGTFGEFYFGIDSMAISEVYSILLAGNSGVCWPMSVSTARRHAITALTVTAAFILSAVRKADFSMSQPVFRILCQSLIRHLMA